MTMLERLGLAKKDIGIRGQYASVGENDDQNEGKEGAELSLQEQHQALLESHRKLKLRFRGLFVVFGLACLGFVIGILNMRASMPKRLIPSPVPDMPKTVVRFDRNETFAGPSTPENDAAWSELMPPGDGFILIPSPSTYDLPPGKDTKHGPVYDISLFHQLHCLAHIRNHYYLTQESLHSNNSEAIQEVLLRPQEDHVHHCFDYLRQGLMCAGDLTVEWPRTEEDGRRFAVDGWGVSHECKSWDAIMDFMKENDVASKIWTA